MTPQRKAEIIKQMKEAHYLNYHHLYGLEEEANKEGESELAESLHTKASQCYHTEEYYAGLL